LNLYDGFSLLEFFGKLFVFLFQSGYLMRHGIRFFGLSASFARSQALKGTLVMLPAPGAYIGMIEAFPA
jgi:hypothetical protein